MHERHQQPYLAALAELTDNYRKTFTEIRADPTLDEGLLKSLSKEDIKQAIKIGRQKRSRDSSANYAGQEQPLAANLGKRKALAPAQASSPEAKT